MINIDRSLVEAPEIKGKTYRTAQILDALGLVFHNKCYLCEICLHNPAKFEIDHFIAQATDRSLRTEWDNLYLACSDCNKSKSSDDKPILDPCSDDVETLLEYEIVEGENIFYFTTHDLENEKAQNTCFLLSRLHNGSKTTKLKTASLRDAIINTHNELAVTLLKLQKAEDSGDKKTIQKCQQKITHFVSRKSPFTMFMRNLIEEFRADLKIYYD